MSSNVGSFGVFGLSLTLLIIALIGGGQYKLGGLFLGMVIAVHPFLGAFCILIVMITFLWDYKNQQENLNKFFIFFLAACLISAFSLGYQLYLWKDLPNVNSAETKNILLNYVNYWDYHRQPIKLWSYGILTCIASLLMFIFALLYLKKELPTQSLFILKLMIVSAILSIALALTTLLPSKLVSDMLLSSMPGRFQNLNNLAFVVLLIGILGNNNSKNFFFYRLILFVFVLCSLSLMIIAYNLDLPKNGKLFNQTKLLLPLCVALSLIVVKIFSEKLQGYFKLDHKHRLINSIYRAILIIFVSMGVIALSESGFSVLSKYNGWGTRKETFRDWTNEPLYAEISKGKGYVLSSGIAHIQLYTRRPTLFGGGMVNILPYVPELGLEVNKVSKHIYGVNLLQQPPDELRNNVGKFPGLYYKDLWENRSKEQWREIKKQFGVFDILTLKDWKLNLPIIIQNEKYILYHIDD